MAKCAPRAVKCPLTGRTGWPDVLRYQDRAGRLYLTPPKGKEWCEIIYNIKERDRLAASGALYSAAHIGPVARCIDNRRTS